MAQSKQRGSEIRDLEPFITEDTTSDKAIEGHAGGKAGQGQTEGWGEAAQHTRSSHLILQGRGATERFEKEGQPYG